VSPRLFALLLIGILSLVACQREQRRFSEPAPANRRPELAPISELRVRDRAAGEIEGPYADNAWAVAEGKRLYTWFNCVGCHAQGGGGMGPALMDETWIYGGAPWEIYASIVQGRANGMPSFAGKIPDAQVWQIVAYVRSLSGQLRKDVRPSRSDHMRVKEPEQSTERRPPARAIGPEPPR
jgi:cytochrome c oxidase cbb3-type subunit 3